MDDVELAGEVLDGGPFEPMPEIIEDAHRDPAIDDPCAERGTGPGRGTVLPGARKDGDAVIVRSGVGTDHLVHVFADTRARAKGGTIVDQDAHRLKTTTVSGVAERTCPDIAATGMMSWHVACAVR